MSKLHELFRTADSLLEQTVDTLALTLLRIVADTRQNGIFWPDSVTQVTFGTGMTAEHQHAYPYDKRREVDTLVAETFEELRRTGLILPAPGQPAGYMVLSRAGEEASKRRATSTASARFNHSPRSCCIPRSPTTPMRRFNVAIIRRQCAMPSLQSKLASGMRAASPRTRSAPI
jgi:hypothetical protein